MLRLATVIDVVKQLPERCAATPAAGAPSGEKGVNVRITVTFTPAGTTLVRCPPWTPTSGACAWPAQPASNNTDAMTTVAARRRHEALADDRASTTVTPPGI